MADGKTAPVTVRKRKVVKGGDGHHGGAWKVAYADFVTAMMAFFLLMWLLNATTEKQRKGLADYFDPSIPISPVSGGGASVLNGDSVTTRDVLAGSSRDGVRVEREARTPRNDGTPAGGEAAEPVPEARPEDAEVADALAEQVRRAMDDTGDGLDRHFIVHTSPEGLVIELVDGSEQPLFPSGSDRPGPLLPRLVEVLVPVLEMTRNPLKIVGHTDARPFSARGRDNWSLSAARANAARRLMLEAGLEQRRIAEVSGKAATRPLLPDPEAPQNRRIAVTLLRMPAR